MSKRTYSRFLDTDASCPTTEPYERTDDEEEKDIDFDDMDVCSDGERGPADYYSDGEGDLNDEPPCDVEAMVDRPKERRAGGASGGSVDYHWKHFFLTYSQANNLTKERIFTYLSDKEPSLNKIVVGQEFHLDGNKHFHVYMQFAERKRVRNCRVWDIDGIHPNIQKVKSQRKCMDYCIKDGDWMGDFELPRHNYRREKADMTEWQSDRRFRLRPDVQWPICLPGGFLQLEPRVTDKKCNWWLVGAPDSGKTKWSQTYFGSQKVYDVPVEDKYRFEGYRGERVIIYDDVMPRLAELLRLCNVWERPAEVPYACRYQRNYLPVRTRLCVIVLSNLRPGYEDRPSFLARFNIREINKF